jgi:hypothetical protein
LVVGVVEVEMTLTIIHLEEMVVLVVGVVVRKVAYPVTGYLEMVLLVKDLKEVLVLTFMVVEGVVLLFLELLELLLQLVEMVEMVKLILFQGLLLTMLEVEVVGIAQALGVEMEVLEEEVMEGF